MNDEPVKIEYEDGTVKYFNKEGELHRVDGPAIEYCRSVGGGGSRWFFKGKKHRENGPAVIHADGSMEYWFNGKRHRLDGPAYISSDDTYKKWYFEGEYIECSSLEEFQKIIKLKWFW